MARRISASSIKWAELAERVPAGQRQQFLAFKARSDSYLRRLLANPEAPPKIDWAVYKNKVAVAGLVDNFQKSYGAVQVPYPPDTVSSQVEEQEKAVKVEIDKYIKNSKELIIQYQEEIAKLESQIPYSEMTFEEFAIAHPEKTYNAAKPTFWPHLPEEQLDYKEPTETVEKAH